MGPLTIYIAIVVLLLGLSLAVRIWKHTPTRRCPLCESRVEIGRSRCQVCGYNFALTQRPKRLT
jgi:hypothetical protein